LDIGTLEILLTAKMAAILQNGGHFTKWPIFLLYTSADTCKYTCAEP